MNTVFVLVLTCLLCGRGEGFFSKISNRKKSESNRIDDEFVDVCKTVRVMPRIAMAVVGGAPLKSENSAPYIAAVGERVSNGSISWFCGGSLISPYDILTAAHCLISRNVSTVRLGSFSTKKKSTENDYEILETIIHPGYKITESYNDIAVIKVKNRITLDSNIKPVCLPQDDSDRYEKERARVIGWGAEEFGGEGSQKLQQVEVEVFSNSNCEKAYRNSTIAPKTFPRGIEKEQLCAGSSKGGKDACQGDSGGPLVLTDQRGIVRQIGIVSTGAGCGFKMYPGVYARVSSYVNWIQEQMKKGSSQSRHGVDNPSKEMNSNGKEKSNQRPTNERTTTKPTKSQNLINDHTSQKEKQNSREVPLKNEFSHNPHGEKHSPEYKDPERPNNNKNTGQSSRTTSTTRAPNYNDRQTSTERPGVHHLPSSHSGSSREQNMLHPRPTGSNGSSSRERISSRIPEEDQLSSAQRPSRHHSP